jgi:RNA polymerase sigma-70 factor (ECF subfamily)
MDADLRLKQVVDEHFGRVAAYLLSRTDRDSAAEALARTLEVVWQRLEDLPSDPLPWLLGVARRVLSDQWRAQSRRDALMVRLTEAENMRHRAMVQREERDDAALDRLVAVHALSGLADSEREVLLLVAWDGLTAREASRVLGCTRGAFAVRLFRARAHLRDQIAAHRVDDLEAARTPNQAEPQVVEHQVTDEIARKKEQ